MSIFFQGCGRNLEQLEEKPTQAEEEDVQTVLPYCLCYFLRRDVQFLPCKTGRLVIPKHRSRCLSLRGLRNLPPTTWSRVQPAAVHMETAAVDGQTWWDRNKGEDSRDGGVLERSSKDAPSGP